MVSRLSGQACLMPGDSDSVLTADASLGEDNARYLCVVRDPHGRFPCARDGRAGLEEAYARATRVREVIEQDTNAIKPPIIAIVDVQEIQNVRDELIAAIKDAHNSPVVFWNRLQLKEALETRKTSILTRSMLEARWAENQTN